MSEATRSSAPAAAAAEQPWPDGRQAWYTIWLIALVTLIATIDRSVINLLVQPIKTDLALSDTQMSLIVGAAFSLFYIAAGFPMSRISDVRSRKLVLAGSLVAWSAATSACGFMKSFTGLFIARGAVGAAESVPGPASLSMIADLVPRHKLPRAFAIYQLGIGVGQSAALFIGGVLLGWYATFGTIGLPGVATFAPWQMVFITCGIPGLLVAVLWLATVKEPPRRNRRRAGSVPIREVLAFLNGNKALYLPMFVGLAVTSIETAGSTVWRAPMFERSYGWAPAQFGPLIGTVNLLMLPVSLIGGAWLAEHLIKRGDTRSMLRVAVLTNIASMPFQVFAPLMASPWACFVMLVISMILGGMAGPAINSAIQMVTPNEMRAQVSALYLLSMSAVGAWFGPLLVALTTDFVFRDEAQLYLAMSGFALVLSPLAIVLMWIAMRAFGQAMREREAVGA